MHLVAEGRYLLPPVVEESGLVRLDDDDVKQVPPVLPYDVVHPSIAEQEGRDEMLSRQHLYTLGVGKQTAEVGKSDDVRKTCLHLVVAKKKA